MYIHVPRSDLSYVLRLLKLTFALEGIEFTCGPVSLPFWIRDGGFHGQGLAPVTTRQRICLNLLPQSKVLSGSPQLPEL